MTARLLTYQKSILRASRIRTLGFFLLAIAVDVVIVARPLLAQSEIEVLTLSEANGPVPLRNQFPLAAVHLSFEPQGGAILPSGDTTLSLTNGWSNTFILADNYVIDAESVDSRLQLRHGIDNQNELSIELPFLWRGGGMLDSDIEDWHDLWGLPKGHRKKVRHNQFEIDGTRRGGAGFAVTDRGGSFGNVTFGLKSQILCDSDTSISLVEELSLPRFSNSYGHDGVDVSIGIVGSSAQSWAVLHYGMAALWDSDTTESSIPYSSLHAESFLFAERPITSWLNALVGLYGGSRTVRGISGYPDYFIYLDIGGRIPVDADYAVTLDLRENPAPHDGTTDVSFVAGFEAKWGAAREKSSS